METKPYQLRTKEYSRERKKKALEMLRTGTYAEI